MPNHSILKIEPKVIYQQILSSLWCPLYYTNLIQKPNYTQFCPNLFSQ